MDAFLPRTPVAQTSLAVLIAIGVLATAFGAMAAQRCVLGELFSGDG